MFSQRFSYQATVLRTHLVHPQSIFFLTAWGSTAAEVFVVNVACLNASLTRVTNPPLCCSKTCTLPAPTRQIAFLWCGCFPKVPSQILYRSSFFVRSSNGTQWQQRADRCRALRVRKEHNLSLSLLHVQDTTPKLCARIPVQWHKTQTVGAAVGA